FWAVPSKVDSARHSIGNSFLVMISGWSLGSNARKIRLPLFKKCRSPFLKVFSAKTMAKSVDFHGIPVDIIPKTRIYRFYCLLDRHRGVFRYPARNFNRKGQQFPLGHHMVDQAVLQGLLGIDHGCGEDHFHGPSLPDELGQALGPPK